MNRAEKSILEKGDHIGQEAGIKRLAILESNNDLLCLMMFDVCMQRLQVVIEIFAALPSRPCQSHPQARVHALSLTHILSYGKLGIVSYMFGRPLRPITDDLFQRRLQVRCLRRPEPDKGTLDGASQVFG